MDWKTKRIQEMERTLASRDKKLNALTELHKKVLVIVEALEKGDWLQDCTDLTAGTQAFIARKIRAALEDYEEKVK